MYSKGEVIFVISIFLFVFAVSLFPLYFTLLMVHVTSYVNAAEVAEIHFDDCLIQQVAIINQIASYLGL